MVKFDVRQLRYLSREEFRCLVSLEMGMKNHEVVPCELISSIANLRHGGCFKILRDLVQYKLIRYDHKNGIRGYHLTYAGYDYLALRSLCNQDVIYSIGNKIGVGKESDIYIAAAEDGTQYVLKLHRLGRICFRKVKEKRDYLKKRKNANWLYLSRLAAEREYSFLKALHERGYPVPEPLSWNRHAIVMKLIPGYPLAQVRKIANTAKVYTRLMQLIVRLAQMGLIHGDYNEFNLIIDEKEKVTVIDLPQMISTSHLNAEYYFDRDVECVRTWFRKRYDFDSEDRPYLRDIICDTKVDVEMKASGYTKDVAEDFENLTLNKPAEDGDWDGGESSSESCSNSEEEVYSEDEDNVCGEDVDDVCDEGDVKSQDLSDECNSSDKQQIEGEFSQKSSYKKSEEEKFNKVSVSADRSEGHEVDSEEEESEEEDSEEEESEEEDGVVVGSDELNSDVDEVDNKSYLPYRDKGTQKKANHQLKVYQKSNLSKDDIKKKVRENASRKRVKQSRIKKGEKYFINREKRANASEIKGAENWF